MHGLRPFSKPLDNPLIALDGPSALRAAMLNAGIVVVRGWFGAEEDFVELGRRFGVLERASPRDVLHEGQLFKVSTCPGDPVGVGRYWHADGFVNTTAPALMTIYHVAKGASPVTGTTFIDGCAAWSNLSESLRSRIGDRWWVHASGSRHRFVVNHHMYQLPVILVNLGKISTIEGMNENEMRQTVSNLSEELDREPRYIHRWNPGDILLVDNRRMLHRGPKVIDEERILWRTSVVKYSI